MDQVLAGLLSLAKSSSPTCMHLVFSRCLAYKTQLCMYCCNNSLYVKHIHFHIVTAAFPQRPSKPTLLTVTDTSVTFSWQENKCTGGHTIGTFNIRYAVPSIFFFINYRYILGIGMDQRNYTINDLTPSTSYEVSVQVRSIDSTSSSFSIATSFTTLVQGTTCNACMK